MAPPPFVRIRGPLLPHVTSLTLSTVPERAPGPVMASQTHRIAVDNPDTATQSNMDANAVTGLPPIGVGYLASIPIPAPRMRLTSRKIKKLANAEAQQRLREQASRSGFGMTLPHERKSQAQKDRDALYEGLMFPGMWVTSGASRGPDKELCYRLSLDVHVDNATAGSAASQGPWHMPPIAEGQPETAGEAAALGGGHDSSSSEQAAGADVVTIGKADKPWLTLRSVPLTLLTKAGVKTAKARSMAGTIKADEPFALCIRINAQTVRTRYIKTGTIDSRPCLTSRTGQWDPYQFETIQSPPLPEISPRVAGGNGILSVEDQADLARRLRYGTIGRLRDVQTGAVSPPMKLVRTDANEAILGENSGDGDPVSHLQKVAFVRVVQVTATETGGQWKEVLHKESGLRYYLAAPGARAGGGELQEDKAPGWRKRRKVQPKKETSKEAVVDQGAMSVPNVSDMSNDGGSALNDMSSSIQATPGFPPHDTTEGVMHIPEEGQILPDTLAGSLLHDHTGITSIQPEAASNPHGTDSPGPLELYTTQAQLEEQPEALSSSPAPAASTQAVADAKYKTKRGALAQAVVDEQGGDSMIQLAWEVATERKRALRPFGLMKSKYKQEADIEGVADWMTYVIAGVGTFM